jgi:hypothetical protein
MTGTGSATFFVGWDVGGWNCDRNTKSRDALAIVDDTLTLVGRSWRGNLRAVINESVTTRQFVGRLFALCHAEFPNDATHLTLGIDTPLGFSREFAQLVTRAAVSGPVGESATNAYLLRRTERFLFERGLRPLSAVKDMIGSQATKGMHVLGKFAPVIERCGVWRSHEGPRLTAIEAYPSGANSSQLITSLRARVTGMLGETDDERDALTCALIAYLFANQPQQLESPNGFVPDDEGWIWVPTDALGR